MSCWSYMSDFVRPHCWFCIQKCSPPSRTKILSGFLRAMLAPFGGQAWLSCGYVGTAGTILGGHLGASHDAMRALHRIQLCPSRRNRIKPKNNPKNKISSKTLILTKIRLQKLIRMAGTAKRSRARLKRKPPPSRAIWARCFCGNCQLECKGPTPCNAERRGQIFGIDVWQGLDATSFTHPIKHILVESGLLSSRTCSYCGIARSICNKAAEWQLNNYYGSCFKCNCILFIMWQTCLTAVLALEIIGSLLIDRPQSVLHLR